MGKRESKPCTVGLRAGCGALLQGKFGKKESRGHWRRLRGFEMPGASGSGPQGAVRRQQKGNEASSSTQGRVPSKSYPRTSVTLCLIFTWNPAAVQLSQALCHPTALGGLDRPQFYPRPLLARLCSRSVPSDQGDSAAPSPLLAHLRTLAQGSLGLTGFAPRLPPSTGSLYLFWLVLVFPMDHKL